MIRDTVFARNKNYLLDKSLFAFISMCFCLLLAFRPIPDITNANDTPRYITMLHQFCSGTLSHDLLNKELSYNFFYSVNYASCLIKSDGVFLFQVSILVPLMFLLFSRWRAGTILWGLAFLFSVYGLELMTNAMRQNFAMLIFFGALALLHRYKFQSLVLGCIAVIAHTSALAYFPLLLWLYGFSFTKRSVFLLLGISFALVGVFFTPLMELLNSLASLQATYAKIYANSMNTSFILFMTVPMFFVYFIRVHFEKCAVSKDERRVFFYSVILLLLTLIFMPLIAYRFTLFSVSLQIFMVSRANKQSIKVAWFGFIGLLAHLLLMLVISNHFEVLIYG